jgi:hypothetical protein
VVLLRRGLPAAWKLITENIDRIQGRGQTRCCPRPFHFRPWDLSHGFFYFQTLLLFLRLIRLSVPWGGK